MRHIDDIGQVVCVYEEQKFVTVQDFYPTKELPNKELSMRRCQEPEIAEHADGGGNVIDGFVNVVTAYQGPFAQHRDFVRTFPVELVLVICEVPL